MSDTKIPSLIIKNVEKLIQQSIPSISEIIQKTGIKTTLPPEFPSCLPQDEIQDILNIRNNLVNKLNSTSKIIESLSKITNTLTPILNTTKTSLNIAKATVNTSKIAITAIPPTVPIPGQLIIGLNIADDLVNNTLPPIITQTSNKITSIATSTDYANSTIFKLLNLIKSIDQYLTNCGISNSSLISTNDYINGINQQYTNTQNLPNTYQGFILEIIEEPFSPTVNRRKAVAKNNDDIILLSTPLSFTTDNQTLINQIKLIIDSNDLKAY